MPRSIPRELVYEAIDGERDYQEALPPIRTDGEQRSVGDYLVMLDEYVRRAKVAWTDNPGNAQALDVIRKVAGIAVHCMEDHGAPRREVPSDVALALEAVKELDERYRIETEVNEILNRPLAEVEADLEEVGSFDVNLDAVSRVLATQTIIRSFNAIQNALSQAFEEFRRFNLEVGTDKASEAATRLRDVIKAAQLLGIDFSELMAMIRAYKSPRVGDIVLETQPDETPQQTAHRIVSALRSGDSIEIGGQKASQAATELRNAMRSRLDGNEQSIEEDRIQRFND